MTPEQIKDSFRPLSGLPCWHVKRGYGSFLTMEFGKPSMEILLRPNGRRVATVHGQWHLWTYCCDWGVFEGDELIGDVSENERMDRSAAVLDGQMLTCVRVYKNGRTDFRFEHGTELMTRPFDTDSEQWLLYEPDGMVLTFRADGKYSRQAGNLSPDEQMWLDLPRRRKPTCR